MASEIAAVNRENSQELEDLQAQYAKRRRTLVDQQQNSLSELNQNYEKRKAQIEHNDEAAISHIRKDGAERFEAQRSLGEVSLQNERETNQKALAVLKKYAESTRKGTEEQIRQETESSAERLKNLHEQQEAQIQKANKDSHDYFDKQQKFTNETRQKLDGELVAIEQKAATEKSKTTKKSEAEVAEIRSHYQEIDEKTRALEQHKLDLIKEDGTESLERTRKRTSDALEKEHQSEDKHLHDMHKHFDSEVKRADQIGREKIANQTRADQSLFEIEKSKGEKKVESIHESNQKQLAAETQVDEERVHEVKDKTFREIHQLQDADKHQTAAERARFETQMKQIDQEYNKHIEHNKEAYQENLKRQTGQFKSTYQKTEAANRESLNIQKEMYSKELAETKRNVVDKVKFYEDRSDDPFYKMHDQGTRVHDRDRFYILETTIPEHEKDNFKVRIEKNKAVVTGSRAFNDRTEDEDKKILTNNFQTFREEFHFDEPVSSVGITEERHGERLLYKIPKLAFSKLSRKA